MKVVKYFIYIIFTKYCIQNFLTQFPLKILYVFLVKISYSSSIT